jgi:hypothetical protein
MQQDGERRRDANKFAVHLNVIASIWFGAEVGASLAVNRDPPIRD